MKVKPLDNQKGSSEPTLIAQIPFTQYIVASKKSGKTTLLLNLLMDRDFLKGKFNEIIWVSPTASMDDKIQKLKNVDNLLVKNTLLINLLRKIQERREILDDGDIRPLMRIDDIHTKMDDNDFKEEMTLKDLHELLNQQKSVVNNFGKKYANNVLLVLDDSIEDKILKTPQFRKFIFASRHYKISVIFISQSYFSLSKSLRLNNSELLVFDTGSKKELNKIYEENENGLTFKKFMSMFNEITKEPYAFLNINYDNKKSKRFINGFEEIIDVSEF